MRMTEQELEAIQNKRNSAQKHTLQLDKSKSDAKVHDANNNGLERKLEQNKNTNEKPILKCEIASIPPSVNHYWVKTGRGFKLSDKARDFHDLVALIIPSLQIKSRLKLDVTFHFPNRLRRDLDNYLKATIDSLVKCGLCVDDEQFDELIVKRGNVIKGGLIKIEVLELQGG